jgi:hypothetical protein
LRLVKPLLVLSSLAGSLLAGISPKSFQIPELEELTDSRALWGTEGAQSAFHRDTGSDAQRTHTTPTKSHTTAYC